MTRSCSLGIALAGTLCACAPPAPFNDDVLPTGTSPNDVAIARCGGARVALVAASGDARVDVLALDADARPGAARAVFFGEGSTPWAVALVPERAVAVTSLFGAHNVALLDPCAERVLARAAADVVFSVAPLTLPVPVDADGDGVDDRTVTRLRPRTPQAVVAVDDDVFVTFTNVLAFSTGADAPMITGPGMLARFTVDDEVLRFVDAVVLPCENPQGLVADGDSVVVSCTGRFVVADGAHRRVSDGGLVRVATSDLRILHHASVAGSPGTPAILDGDVVVGDVLDGRVRRFDADFALLDETDPDGDVESVFATVVADDGRIVAARFGRGDVVVDPFDAAIVVPLQQGGPSRGLVDIAVDDDEVFGLFTLSAELVRKTLP